jgi:hypothetical protein
MYLEQARRTENRFYWRRGHRAHEVQGSPRGAASPGEDERRRPDGCVQQQLGFVGKTIRQHPGNYRDSCVSHLDEPRAGAASGSREPGEPRCE